MIRLHCVLLSWVLLHPPVPDSLSLLQNLPHPEADDGQEEEEGDDLRELLRISILSFPRRAAPSAMWTRLDLWRMGSLQMPVWQGFTSLYFDKVSFHNFAFDKVSYNTFTSWQGILSYFYNLARYLIILLQGSHQSSQSLLPLATHTSADYSAVKRNRKRWIKKSAVLTHEQFSLSPAWLEKIWHFCHDLLSLIERCTHFLRCATFIAICIFSVGSTLAKTLGAVCHHKIAPPSILWENLLKIFDQRKLQTI